MNLRVPIFFLSGVLSAAAVHSWSSPKEMKTHFGSALKGMASLSQVLAENKAFALDAATDRLVLIKALYLFVNGGADGTWPDGESGDLTGHNAPSDRLKGGFLGLVNDVIGPNGAVSEFLESQGYSRCADLPSTETTFDVTDPHEGALKVTVSSSTRAIPTGLVNTGNFEKRILISKAADDSRLAAIHLHCSTPLLTMLVRMDTDLETEGQVEAVEAIVEGSVEGPDMHLQFITQNAASPGRDMALKFITEEGDDFKINMVFTSGADDANGNGPSHVAAGIAGNTSSDQVALHVMGGNADLSGASVSNDVAGLPLDATQTPDQMAAGNQFCVNKTTAADTTGCETIVSPGTPAISGLSAWTLNGIYAVRQGTSNVDALSTY